MFGEGISRVGELIDLGVKFDILQKSGSWFSYDGTRIGQGRDAVKQLLKDNQELADEIAAKISDILRGHPDALAAGGDSDSEEVDETEYGDLYKRRRAEPNRSCPPSLSMRMRFCKCLGTKEKERGHC